MSHTGRIPAFTNALTPVSEGRLLQAALNLLAGADIQFRRENRLDIALAKNLPIALIFLPAADIPTFVGEGRVDIGITGHDQVKEHDAGVRTMTRARHMSGELRSEQRSVPHGCETVLQLGFGSCKLQVQVPQNGTYATPKDLIGKNIGTSFVHLAHEYFARLEREEDGAAADDPAQDSSPTKLRTNIIELSGSVEAACALGVADGIVDLVGQFVYLVSRHRMRVPSDADPFFAPCRIWRDNEGRRLEGHRHGCRIRGDPDQV